MMLQRSMGIAALLLAIAVPTARAQPTGMAMPDPSKI